ncbi:MAG: FAD-binding protein, partial [Planctomycetota bacterium]
MSEAENVLVVREIDEIQGIIAKSNSILVSAGRTKRCLSEVPPSFPSAQRPCSHVSMKEYAGFVQYEASEFTFTAKAGTTLIETVSELEACGQYLPFDPMLLDTGATLGGTICAGLSGPGRFRFGGLRDFILGATIVLGNGDVVRVGGKVVKNAAGFDVPKLMVGSLGQFGVLVDLTMKVFPKPAALMTARWPTSDINQAATIIAMLAGSSLELDAIDLHDDLKTVWIRIAGPVEANSKTLLAVQEMAPEFELVSPDDANDYWLSLRELQFAEQDSAVLKLPLTLAHLPLLQQMTQELNAKARVSAAGNVAWIAFSSAKHIAKLDELLREYSLSGLLIRRGCFPTSSGIRFGIRNTN